MEELVLYTVCALVVKLKHKILLGVFCAVHA
jgi:hypothetical protein